MVTSAAAQATQPPSDGCNFINGGGFNVTLAAGTSGSASFTRTFTAGERITFTWANMASLQVDINGSATITVNGDGSQTLEVLSGSVTFTKQAQAATSGPGSVSVTCDEALVPVTPDSPGTIPLVVGTVFAAIADQLDEREPERLAATQKLIRDMELHNKIVTIEAHLRILGDPTDAANRAQFPDVFGQPIPEAQRAEEERVLMEQREELYRQLGRTPPPLGGPQEGVTPGGGIDAPDTSIFDQIGESAPVINFAPTRQSRLDPSLEAISQFFDLGDRSVTASAPLQSQIPGWSFGAAIDAGVIEQTFGALQRRTSIGSLTIVGSTSIDETILGLGLKLGAAAATLNTPAASISALQLGADVHLLRPLAPGISGSLFGGYELGFNSAMIAGVASPFVSHTLKAGAGLRGVIALDELTLTPALSALFQYRHAPAFTDGAGQAVPAIDTIDVDVTGGITVSRYFELVEHNAAMTPFLTVNGLLDYTSSSAGPLLIPTDAFKLQAVAGVGFAWDNGIVASVQVDVTAGATTVMYGVTGKLNVPIN